MHFRHQEQPLRRLSRMASALNIGLESFTRLRRAVRGYATVARFASRGDAFSFDPDGIYSYENISVGSHVNLGVRPTLLATRSHIRIGNHVMFGPGVTIRGGNHRFDIVGRFIDTIGDEEKVPGDDLGVTIQDDVWIGGNATVLGGVTIGEGSVIAASSVVTKDIPPYTVAAGNPARAIGSRFTPDEVEEHRRIMRKDDVKERS